MPSHLPHTAVDGADDKVERLITQTPSVVAGPRYDQAFPQPRNTASTIDSMSHAPTGTSSKPGPQDEGSMAGSVYSYSSTRDITRFVAEHFGRTFNALNDTYLLPSDEAEWNRLDKQHSAFLIALGGLYPCPEIVEPLLAPDGPLPKQILDIGCGTGAWAIEMARRFPHAFVKGVDVAPIPQDVATMPPNLEFEIDDVNFGLNHFANQFDFVHMRLVRGGLRDLGKTIRDAQACLRPGGLFLLIEADQEFHSSERDGRLQGSSASPASDFVKMKLAKLDEDEDVSAVSEEGSWFSRVFWEMVDTNRIAKADIGQGSELLDRGLWDQPLLDPATAVSGSVYLPIGPWAQSSDPAETQLLVYVGVIMRQVCTKLHRTFHPMLLKYGLSQEVLDEWSNRSQEELDTMSRRFCVRCPFSWARRRAGDGLPAPPLPPMPTDPARLPVGPSNPTTRFKYPFFELFRSSEESMAARQRRRATLGDLPTSAVSRAYAAMTSPQAHT